MKNKTLGEMYSMVMEHDNLREIYFQQCNNEGLKFGSSLHGGCRVQGKKVGIQKFMLKQKYIAASIYRSHFETT